MALVGTVTTSSSGLLVTFSTSDSGFRARTLVLGNLGPGGVFVDIHSTSASSTGYSLADGSSLTLANLNGVSGFSVVASSAAGAPELNYLASR